MNTYAKFEVIGQVIDYLEMKINYLNEAIESSTTDMRDRIDELSQTFSGDDLDSAIEGSYRIKADKDEIESYTLQCKIVTYLKDHLYDNFQKIIK